MEWIKKNSPVVDLEAIDEQVWTGIETEREVRYNKRRENQVDG
jgi:hypothetical protein